jgi:hypothetical protein
MGLVPANLVEGSIAAAGTVSTPVDLSGYMAAGFIATSAMTSANLSFQVATTLTGTYVDVRDAAGAVVSIGPVSGTFALSGTVMEVLRGYRFIRVKTSVAQTSGLSFVMPLKS